MRRAPHTRGRSKASAALLIMALALGQLGAMVHATALHARCAEHGELIHTGANADGRLARGLAASLDDLARDGSSDELHGLPAEGGGHAHDHCLATCATRERATAPVDASVAAERVEAREVAVYAHVERATARPLYRTAPKNSPPV